MAKIVHLRNIKRALQVEPKNSVKYSVGGRVSNFRSYKSFNFIDLIDGSTREHLQVVIKKSLLKKPQLGSYLICQGDIAPSPGPSQPIEFRVNQVDYLGQCDPLKYPLVIDSVRKQISEGWFRQNLHLRPRASHFASLLRVRSELEMSLHMIFRQMDFFKVHTPILTANDSEASSDLFAVQRSKHLAGRQQSRWTQPENDPNSSTDSSSDSGGEASRCEEQDLSKTAAGLRQMERDLKEGYFRNKDVFMITSAQLHLESLAASLSRVYCLAPAFRAETTMSQRHLCEFTMVEAEESNLTTLEPLMNRVESIVKFAAQYLGEVSEFRTDFATLLGRNSHEKIYQQLSESNYIRMAYDEAIEILQKPTFASTGLNCQYGCDLNRKHERALLQYCDNVPIFLTNYPKNLKPFYMKSCDKSLDKVLNFDLIAPFGGEICGGSLREDDLQMLQKNLNLDQYNSTGMFCGVPLDGSTMREKPHPNHKLDDVTGSSSGRILTQPGGNVQSKHPFSWYLELYEFGPFPHGGFGIGLERLIQSLVGIKNIKDTVAFPRWPGNCSM